MFIPVFVVVHIYSCLFTGIILLNSNLERNWNIHEYSSLFMFLEFQGSSFILINSSFVQVEKNINMKSIIMFVHFYQFPTIPNIFHCIILN